MKYERPAFGDISVKTVKARIPFDNSDIDLPVFDLPISIRENFYRAANRDNPYWVPFPATDFQELHMSHLGGKGPEGQQLGPDLAAEAACYSYTDAFGNHWTYDRNAGGACMTPGTRICDDILKWEDQVHFPDYHEWDFVGAAERFMKEEYDPNRVLHLDLYHGPFQALADLLGGFAEALQAMFVEPEASRAFFDRFAEWMIWQIDMLSELYPVDMFTVHDDWGTEKDAFFSPAMMEELLYEPTKRIIDHVKGLGKVYQFHNCGQVHRFMPYMCDLKPEFMQLQRRVNDIPAYKKQYGGHIGFQCSFEGLNPKQTYSAEEVANLVKNTLDLYAHGGGFFPSVRGLSQETFWQVAAECFCRSREMYDAESGR